MSTEKLTFEQFAERALALQEETNRLLTVLCRIEGKDPAKAEAQREKVRSFEGASRAALERRKQRKAS